MHTPLEVAIFLCAVGVASAGNLLRAAPPAPLPQGGPIAYQLVDLDDSKSYAVPPPPITYESAPAVYTQTYSAPVISPLNTKIQPSPLTYASAVPIVSYSAPVAETIVPASYANIGNSAPMLYSGGPSIAQNYGVPAQNTKVVAPIQAAMKLGDDDENDEDKDDDDKDDEKDEENDTDKEGESENENDSDSECDSDSEEDDD